MASIGSVTLTIMRIPNSANAAINVRYSLAGDAVDIALQTPYLEVCQLIGDDKPGSDDILLTLRNQLTFFPEDPVTSNPIVQRNLNRVVPLSVLDEDTGRPFPEEDEIRAKVTLTLLTPNFRESNLVRLGGPVIGHRARPDTDITETT